MNEILKTGLGVYLGNNIIPGVIGLLIILIIYLSCCVIIWSIDLYNYMKRRFSKKSSAPSEEGGRQ